MGPVQPLSFFGSFMVRVVTWLVVELSTSLGSGFPILLPRGVEVWRCAGEEVRR